MYYMMGVWRKDSVMIYRADLMVMVLSCASNLCTQCGADGFPTTESSVSCLNFRFVSEWVFDAKDVAKLPNIDLPMPP